MKEFFFVLEYGQWLILVISILALYLVSSVNHKTRLKGYLVTALSRFSGAIIFLFVDLFAFVIANLIQTYISIRGYFQNKRAVELTSRSSEVIAKEALQVIWIDGDISRVNEFYAENFTTDYPSSDWGQGLKGLSALLLRVRKEFSGFTYEIEELLTSDDKVVAILFIILNHPVSNEKISFKDVTIITIEKEKIIHQRGLTNLFSLYSKSDMIN